MSIGMGMTFVPLTLTAVHHVRAEDSGIGSGVLNTMQQVGGALGLATLSTVSLHFVNNRADGRPDRGRPGAGIDPSSRAGRSTLHRGGRSSRLRSPRARPPRSWWVPS